MRPVVFNVNVPVSLPKAAVAPAICIVCFAVGIAGGFYVRDGVDELRRLALLASRVERVEGGLMVLCRRVARVSRKAQGQVAGVESLDYWAIADLCREITKP